MSATISLKHSMARSTDAVLHLIQHGLLIIGFMIVLGLINAFPKNLGTNESPDSDVANYSDTSSHSDAPDYSAPVPAPEVPPTAALSPRMQGALDYVTRRYRVAPEALVPVFEVAQLVGKERHIDPLLIVAIIGIESGFNPFAESNFGAQGLMQIIPRFHLDKLPEGTGDSPLLDPAINVRVGVGVLEEAIQRRGGLVAGLQYYAGSSDLEGNYASKVLAEKARLEQASRRSIVPNA